MGVWVDQGCVEQEMEEFESGGFPPSEYVKRMKLLTVIMSFIRSCVFMLACTRARAGQCVAKVALPV